MKSEQIKFMSAALVSSALTTCRLTHTSAVERKREAESSLSESELSENAQSNGEVKKEVETNVSKRVSRWPPVIVEEERRRCEKCNVIFPSRNKLFQHIKQGCPEDEFVKQKLREQEEQKKKAIEEDMPKQEEHLKNIEEVYQQILSDCRNSDELQNVYDYLQDYI